MGQKRTKTLLLTFILSSSILLVSFAPKTNASLNGASFVEEVTSLPFTQAQVVDVDSAGRIFVSVNPSNDVYRSIDGGNSWTRVLDGPDSGLVRVFLLYVDSRDYIFVLM
jgi:hypothetical protein